MATEGLRRIPRRLLIGAAIVIAMLVMLVIARAPMLRGVADLVTVEHALTEADFIYLLNGDVHARPFLAAELYRKGFAPQIVIARSEDRRATELGLYPNDTDAAIEVLLRSGVPESAIVQLNYPSGVTSTWEEGLALKAYLRDHLADTIIVVTSRYHTRRARWNLDEAVGGDSVQLLMAGAPDDRFDERFWWKSEAGLIVYVEEYLKFLHNFFHH